LSCFVPTRTSIWSKFSRCKKFSCNIYQNIESTKDWKLQEHCLANWTKRNQTKSDSLRSLQFICSVWGNMLVKNQSCAHDNFEMVLMKLILGVCFFRSQLKVCANKYKKRPN
jgi:hypothetical protein